METENKITEAQDAMFELMMQDGLITEENTE